MTSTVARSVSRHVILLLMRLVVAFSCYAVFVIAIRHGVHDQSRPPLTVVVLATAVVAAVLWLSQDSLGRIADRLAFGADSAGYLVVRDLLNQMSTTLSVDEVIPRLAEVAGRAARGSRAQVRLWMADGARWSQAWPAKSEPVGASVTVDVQHRGDMVGEIEVEIEDPEVSPFDRRLLDELAGPAGLALSTVRLTYELRRRMTDLKQLNEALRASSARMLNTRAREQRRLQAEIDRRVLPHLALATSEVAQAGSQIEQDVDPALLEAAAAHTSQALDALRTIARGIFPPTLTDAGLATALDGWLDRAGIPATITIEGAADRLHADPEEEACLYFSAVTAVGELAAGSPNSCGALSLRLEVAADVATLSVGGAGSRSLSEGAVTAIRDRAEAFGGTVEIGAGAQETVVRVTVALEDRQMRVSSSGIEAP